MIKQDILPHMINFLFGIILFPFGILMFIGHQVNQYFLLRYIKTKLKALNVFTFHLISKPYSNSIVKSVNNVELNSNLKYYEWSLGYEYKPEQMASILMELDMNHKELTIVLQSLSQKVIYSLFCHSLNYEFKYDDKGLFFSFTNREVFFSLPLQLFKNAWAA